MINVTNCIECAATFDGPDRSYRYELCWRSIAGEPHKPLLTAWLLNPSFGNEQSLDRTLRNVHEFAVRNGFSGIQVINLCARIDPAGKNVKTDPEPFQSENWRVIRSNLTRVRESGGKIVCAWGGGGRPWQARARELAAEVGVRLFAFHFLADGTPGHAGRTTLSGLQPWRNSDGRLSAGAPPDRTGHARP